MDPDNFFAELKRRNVYKVAVAYAVIAWLLIQVTDTVLPRLNLPEWIVTLVIVLVILGFPVALVLAWAFELTPEGVVHADDVAPNRSITRKTGRKLTVVIVLVGAAAAAMFAFQFVRSTASGTLKEEAATIPDQSIAVLPFENGGGNPDTEYLSDGISEALINGLTELQQLKVIARSTAFRYKGKPADPQAVGRELKVRTVLMGLVRQVGENLNVQVDLVDATTGAQLWGQVYERRVSDVLSVKQAIAREVTEKLRLKLSVEQQQQITKRDTTNAEAYQFYLRGRYYWNNRTPADLEKAIAEFQQAVERDPGYALAFVGLSDCYSILEDYTGADGGMEKAKAYADRALQLDNSLAEAHASLASVYQNSWRWAEAEQGFKRSLALNPKYPTARHWYGTLLRDLGRIDEAMAEMTRAQELDPLSPIINQNVALLYGFRDELDKAAEQYEKIIELNPNFPGAHGQLGFYVYLRQGRFDEAIAEIQKAVELSRRRNSWWLASLANAYGKGGQPDAALMIIQELLQRYEKNEANAYVLAIACAGLGDLDKVFFWFEKAFVAHSGSLKSVKTEFAFENAVRGDPRFADLVRRLGLQP
jgi:TolB-like protein